MLERIEHRGAAPFEPGLGETVRQATRRRDLESDPPIPRQGESPEELPTRRHVRRHHELSGDGLGRGDPGQALDEPGRRSMG